MEIQEADPLVKGALLMDFLEQTEAFFGRKVDLLTDQPIKNKILAENVKKTKVLIYDQENQKVSA